jgi:hypothetical protein
VSFTLRRRRESDEETCSWVMNCRHRHHRNRLRGVRDIGVHQTARARERTREPIRVNPNECEGQQRVECKGVSVGTFPSQGSPLVEKTNQSAAARQERKTTQTRAEEVQ